MKTVIILASAIGVFSSAALSNIWKNDKNHSQILFSIEHLGISDVTGSFNEFEVSVQSAQENFSDAVFDLRIQAASIDTRVGMRDNHLRSADFFDVEKYPEITFKSTSIKKNGKDEYSMWGDLTLKGITKNIEVKMEYEGSIQDPKTNKKIAGLEVEAKIKRSDFGLGSNFGAPVLSDEVEIEAKGEFVLQ